MHGPAWADFVDLWYACRDPNGGFRHWPDAGGTADQAGWTVDAFNYLLGVNHRLDDLERGGG